VAAPYSFSVVRSSWRRVVKRLIGTAALAVALLTMIGAPTAVATTGPTPLTKPPRWKVSKREARPYIGRFKLARPHGRQLISVGYAASINSYGYLEGTIAVYTYDRAGRETSWVARTYEYHPLGGTRMAIDVISPANESIFARLRLRVGARGNLTGILEPLKPPYAPIRPQRITLRRAR
jgi:hypothetical protein